MKIFLSIVFLISSFLLMETPVYSQDINPDRMDRDIRIMESALNELFRVERDTETRTDRSRGIRIGTIEANVKGSYLPGYGVIFTIPDATERLFRVQARSGEDLDASRFSYTIEINGDDRAITEEGIKNRITDFFINYAPTIGQLDNDEHVTVVYGIGSLSRTHAMFQTTRIEMRWGGTDRTDYESLPIISMSVQKSDLDAMRSGQINEGRFRDRMTTAVEERSREARRLDLQVFASTLETALNEDRDEVLRLSQKPTFVYLDNFGVFYQMDLHYSPNFILRNLSRTLSEELRGAMEGLRIEFDSLRIEFDARRSGEAQIREERQRLREEMEDARKIIEEESKILQEDARQKQSAALDTIDVQDSLDRQIGLTKELMIDYGRTLSSLNPGHSILLSINIRGRRADEVPNRIVLRVTKSDIEQYEQGNISRDQAIQRIVERRY